MSQLFQTLLIAFGILVIALLAMAIGYFSSRKRCLKKQCDVNPHKPQEGCRICKPHKDVPKNDSHSHND